MVRFPLKEERLTEEMDIYVRYGKKIRYIRNDNIEILASKINHRYKRDLLKNPQPIPVDEILEYHIQKKNGINFGIED